MDGSRAAIFITTIKLRCDAVEDTYRNAIHERELPGNKEGTILLDYLKELNLDAAKNSLE